ncbi:putative Smr domain-containing protein [Lupinus albus]|uniref:Putative Smr domain-containing protein n=1 Tax=Lupinus albus TaxID=3870 RepID=A0A6A4PGN2_LUPAL|nr:putative Smr domain-containing protein [Lupinus albus]
MSLFKTGSQTDTKLNSPSKAATLNPNAAEFVPFALRSSPSGSTGSVDAASRLTTSESLGKAVFDRSGSSIPNNSDDEAHHYWRCQLPDDITPDFKVMGEDESQGLTNLSLLGLSIHDDDDELSRFPSKGSRFILNEQQHLNGNTIADDKFIFSNSTHMEEPSSASLLSPLAKPWDKQIGNTNHHFLASLFPGFASESLAEVYFANGCDLHLTIDMLTQLELQADDSFNQNLNSKALSAPNLTPMDFPALTSPNGQTTTAKYATGNAQQSGSPYLSSGKDMLMFRTSSSLPSTGAIDFASAVRKLASQDSGIWKYDRNGSGDASTGSSRSLNVLASAYNGGQGSANFGDRSQNRGSARTVPIWLETGDAVANMYSDLREEARNHARLRNAYFEQARQAYLVGNKALAKELGAKGQVHNMHMKAAHGKAQESIYRQRNPIGPEMQVNGRGHERIIDLHGLHVSEALHVLRHELSVLRSTASAAEQRLQVYICVGTGHHTRGSRTPARLPIAVQRYLLEEEGLDFTEPQPGLLRVVI